MLLIQFHRLYLFLSAALLKQLFDYAEGEKSNAADKELVSCSLVKSVHGVKVGL